MSYAQLCEHRVDRPDLYPRSSANVPEFCCGDVVCAIWLQQWQCGKALDDLDTRFRARKSLEQLLQDQTRGDDDIGSEQGVLQFLNFWLSPRGVAAQRERPDARIDEESHLRERSAL